MKIQLAVAAYLCIVLSSYSLAQNATDCGTSGSTVIDLEQSGGIYITAERELKVLVVFARFRDDVTPHAYWPVRGNPQDYSTFIDPNVNTNSTHYLNLTHYFKKMSLGTFKVVGQAVSVQTPRDRADYIIPPATLPNRFLANKEVLQISVDPLINFADYDNWRYDSVYHHTNVPDGTVDMIVMIWRGAGIFGGWSGEASLGNGDPFPGSFPVESGTKTVKTWFGGGDGSGVTVHASGERSREVMFKVSVHEVGHWLLGGDHPYGGGNDSHIAWGILTRGFDAVCANTYERERLAWIYPTNITGDILNAPFQDYIESGTAYKYHPLNGAPNEYYYFENHQKLSVYDNATLNPNDKGIFVIHQLEPYNGTNNIRVKTSNGQWHWENPFSSTCYGGQTLPAFRRTTLNRNGRNTRDALLTSSGGSELLFNLIRVDGSVACGDFPYGAGIDNSFNLAYNDVFSPYSNPYSRTWTNAHTDFTMEVYDQNGSVVNARFYLTNPLAGKPSKPTLGANPGDLPCYYGWICLVWGADFWDGQAIDTDVNWSELQRKIGSGPWTTVYTGSARNWSDNSITYDPNGETPVYLRVRWRDSQNNWSVWSDLFDTKMMNIGSTQKGVARNTLAEKPATFALSQNYPNPFNPKTNIKFDIPENAFVSLKVYNTLGQEVATVVNQELNAGTYTQTFDASQLASGVYIYKLASGRFSASKKLLLMK